MPPIREYSSWNTRTSDLLEEVESLRKYVFICEGSGTEVNYFRALIDRCGELDLLLHSEGAYERLVRPHERELLENRKKGSQRYVQRLFTEEYGMNPKSNPRVGELAGSVDYAIREESHVNQKLEGSLGRLTCNVGSVIEAIRNDRPTPWVRRQE